VASAEETTIRPATEADAELIFSLILELATYEKLADAVLEARGKAIGYAIFFTTFSTFECKPGIWLEDVYVRPEHRRGGVGRAVMEHLAQIAVERDLVRLEWCALEWNEPALSFYEQLGATVLDDWRMLRLEGEGIELLSRGARTPRLA
jgi:GNAT superfamily N-acetyltransferase